MVIIRKQAPIQVIRIAKKHFLLVFVSHSFYGDLFRLYYDSFWWCFSDNVTLLCDRSAGTVSLYSDRSGRTTTLSSERSKGNIFVLSGFYGVTAKRLAWTLF